MEDLWAGLVSGHPGPEMWGRVHGGGGEFPGRQPRGCTEGASIGIEAVGATNMLSSQGSKITGTYLGVLGWCHLPFS